MKKKLSLDPAALQVESFASAPQMELRATVHAREVTPDPDCQFSYDYGSPCESAPGYTCLNTCAATCPNTCAYSCPNTCGAVCTAGPACVDPY
jgi:hypothetical protein